MRAFISVEIPGEVKKKISDIQKSLPDFKGKMTEPENLHLTLKFLGEIDDFKLGKVREALKAVKFRSFDAEINSLGIFSPKLIRIIWLGVEGCDELQDNIDQSLEGIFPREERFMGHLTIARVKWVKDKKDFLDRISRIGIPAMKFQVRRFELKESVLKRKGPEYQTRGEYLPEK